MIHYWHPNYYLENHEAPLRCTVAYAVARVDGTKHEALTFAVAFCSRKDQFKKSLGRELASTRLRDYATRAVIQLHGKPERNDLLKLMGCYIELIGLPDRPQRFAGLGSSNLFPPPYPHLF